MRVLNIGSLNIDYVYSVDEFVTSGETKSTDQLCVNCGGKGLNQSIALARAGLPTWHAGIIGKEGRFLADELANAGVHTQLLQTKEQGNGHAVIQVNRKGQNCILVYPGTNFALTEDYLDRVLNNFTAGDVLLMQNETNLVAEAIEKAFARGMRVAFNASPIHADIQKYPLEKVHWLFINEIEGQALSGQQDPEKTLYDLRKKYPGTEIILTLGEKGSVWSGENGTVRCDAHRVEALDTTGAGDTFTGFFLRGILDPIPGVAPLELASTASAIAVTCAGAAKSIPAVEEVIRACHANLR